VPGLALASASCALMSGERLSARVTRGSHRERMLTGAARQVSAAAGEQRPT